MTAQPEQSDEAGGASDALSQTASTANGAPRRISDPDYMESLARGLAVIRAFGNDRDELSVADLAKSTGLSWASARRCLHTLSVLGYAISHDGMYRLTPAVLTLGYGYVASSALVRVAQPVLEGVSEELHEPSSLAVLDGDDGDDVVYVSRAATRRILSIGLAVGSRSPVAITSMGRVLLANADDEYRARFLARVKLVRHTPRTIVDLTAFRDEIGRVRAQGYALVDQELEPGLRSIAVPVRTGAGQVTAAINVGVHAGRADAKALRRKFLPVLQAAADEIRRGVGLLRM